MAGIRGRLTALGHLPYNCLSPPLINATATHIAWLPQDKGVTLFSIQVPDNVLRRPDHRDNVIHVAPSRVMLADPLAQYLV